MFTCSHESLWLDYFRVPFRVSNVEPPGWLHDRNPLRRCATLRAEAPQQSSGRVLLFPKKTTTVPGPRRHQFGSITLYATVAPDVQTATWLDATGRKWSPVRTIEDPRHNHVASVWRDHEGNIFLPFDPDEAIHLYWSEGYREAAAVGLASAVKSRALRSYYALRPILPRNVQIMLRRGFARVQRRRDFPSWPIETSLHDLYDVLFSLLVGLARASVPWIAPWPDGRSWAIVLTHDVETADGCRKARALLDLEAERGLRSSWNFVPERYELDVELMAELREGGFEIGVHGLRHDGRDLESQEMVEERGPAIRRYAQEWGAVGFRSPATHRAWDLMPMLGFEYDSSSPDSDPYEPIPGGCCTWLPFFNRNLVELPITLPQDHTLLVVLRQDAAAAWCAKTDFLRQKGGMALVITHPDYVEVDGKLSSAYATFLDSFANDHSAWHALPREVSSWWRRRSESRLVPRGETWHIVGPAAGEARIVYASPDVETQVA